MHGNPLKDAQEHLKLCAKLARVNLEGDVCLVATPRLLSSDSYPANEPNNDDVEYSFSKDKDSFAAKDEAWSGTESTRLARESAEKENSVEVSTLRDLTLFEQPNEPTGADNPSERRVGMQSQSVKDLRQEIDFGIKLDSNKHESELLELINSIKADYKFRHNEQPDSSSSVFSRIHQ